MPKKEKQGIVVSNKMDKTVVVKVASYEPHPKYKKIMEFNKNYKAHDAENVCNEGDIVRIFKRTIDVLRQLCTIDNVSEEIVFTARDAIDKINREPIDVD